MLAEFRIFVRDPRFAAGKNRAVIGQEASALQRKVVLRVDVFQAKESFHAGILLSRGVTTPGGRVSSFGWLSGFVTGSTDWFDDLKRVPECQKVGRNVFGMKKKPYSPPALRNLTPAQAKKLVTDRKNCSEEEAAEFLESLQRQRPQNDQKRNEPLNDNREQEKKRS